MKKKGVSIEEKQRRLLAIFHEKKEVFNLKEIERLGAKSGIVLQTVKDVLELLISDNLVEADKIGSANFYWSLPSRTYQSMIIKKDEYEKLIEKTYNDKKLYHSQIIEARTGKELSEARIKKLQRLNSMKAEYELKSKELESYRKNAPERLQELTIQSNNLKIEANKWTDNIFICKQWIINKFFVTEADVNKNFEIPEELDNIS